MNTRAERDKKVEEFASLMLSTPKSSEEAKTSDSTSAAVHQDEAASEGGMVAEASDDTVEAQNHSEVSMADAPGEGTEVDGDEGSAGDPRVELGQDLVHHREALDLSVEDIARTTKIPATSLVLLEAGRFDELPGDVFVRGFLRSYARCIKRDGDELVRRYAQCGLNPAPVSSELADTLLAKGKRPRRMASGTRPPQPEVHSADAEACADGASSDADSEQKPLGLAVKTVLRDALESAQRRAAARRERIEREHSDARERQAELRARARAATETEIGAQKTSESGVRQRIFIPPRIDFSEDRAPRGPLTLGVIILVIVATLTMSYLLRRPGTSSDGFTLAPAAPSHNAAAAPSLTPTSHA